MDDKTYNEIVERAILTTRIAGVRGFGSSLAVDISREYKTIDAFVRSLNDGSFSFRGCGSGKIEKLKQHFLESQRAAN